MTAKRVIVVCDNVKSAIGVIEDKIKFNGNTAATRRTLNEISECYNLKELVRYYLTIPAYLIRDMCGRTFTSYIVLNDAYIDKEAMNSLKSRIVEN